MGQLQDERNQRRIDVIKVRGKFTHRQDGTACSIRSQIGIPYEGEVIAPGRTGQFPISSSWAGLAESSRWPTCRRQMGYAAKGLYPSNEADSPAMWSKPWACLKCSNAPVSDHRYRDASASGPAGARSSRGAKLGPAAASLLSDVRPPTRS